MSTISSLSALLTKYIKLLYNKTVHITGDETIEGVKTFTDTPLVMSSYPVDSIYQAGDRYIRYNNGIQIVWGG